MFCLRTAIDAITAPTRVPEVGPPEIEVIDISAAFPLKLKLSSRARTTMDPLVVDHVTAVDGGFGVSSRAVRRWDAALEAGAVPEIPGLPADADGRLLALLERYSRCAYHWMASRAHNGIAVRCHPWSLRTSHGNGGNRGVGLAFDCGAREDIPPVLVAAGLVALHEVVVDAHGATGQTAALVPHRAFSKHRRGDAGAIAHSRIVIPGVEMCGEIARIDYGLSEGGGRPIPRSWDPAAVYDDRGRRL